MPRPHLQRVLISGATGTLGFNVVRHLALRHPRTRLHILMRTLDHSLFADLQNVTLEEVDMRDTPRLLAAVNAIQPDAIIHSAASGVRPSRLGYFDFVDLNVSATMQLFRASCEIEGCHFINISTGMVYGSLDENHPSRPWREDDPVNTLHPYGATKAAADCLLRAGAERLGRRLTILRPFSFTGIHDGGGRLFPSLLRAALDREPFAMSAGTQLRDFCAVEDVVRAIALLLDSEEHPRHDIYNVGSGLSVPLGSIVESVAQQLHLDVDIRIGELPFQPLEPPSLVADITRIGALGWQPTINLAYAVWQLARSSFPGLAVTEPQQLVPGR
jgi:UDP-glucose 4-epimerase